MIAPLILTGQFSQPASTTSTGGGHGTNGNFEHFGIAGQTAASASPVATNGYSGHYGLLTMDSDVNTAPIANAGDDTSVNENSSVQLDGTGSFDSDDDQLSYIWVSLDGLNLMNENTATPSFMAPDVMAQKAYRFELTVNDGTQSSMPDTVTITIRDPDWIPVVYTNSASAICLVTVDGNNASIGDLVGAYVNGENRGTGGITIISGQTYSIFNIQTSTIETVTFKVYDESEDKVCDVAYMVQSIPGGDMGTPIDPLPIAATCGNSSPFLSVNNTSISVPFEQGDTSFSLSSNTDWSITENISWLSITSPLSGNGNEIVNIDYEENPDVSDRSGMIVLSGTGVSDVVVAITQSGSGQGMPPWGSPNANNLSGVLVGQARIDGIPAAGNDWIAAFDENGNLAGSGQLVLNAGITFINLTIYGDDPTTPGLDEGMSGNEKFELRLYDTSEDLVLTYPNSGSPVLFAGWSNTNGTPMPGYNNPNDVYDFLNITTDKIPLRPGWNLISTDVAPVDSSVSSIFSALIPNNLEYATGFDNGASFYDPNGLPFLNTLNSFERGFGYWIKVGQDDTLCIEGERLSETFRKGLDASWNLLAYPPQIEQSPDNYFSDIIAANNLLYVTGFDGSSTFFDPAGLPFLNTLTMLENGLGYWVKVSTPVPGQGITGVVVERASNSFSNKYNFVGGKTNLPRGEMISILKESGNPLGQIEVLNGGILRTIPIYLPEEDAAQGTKILFQHTRGTLDLGLQIYGDYEPLNVNLEFKEPNETSSSIHRCYPNPFDQSLTIDYSISERGRVKLEICNVAGKLVWQKEEGRLDPGFYQEMLQTENFLSGSYLVKLYIDQQLIQATKVTAHK
ncbi:hypothetical protein IX84_28910 [Phaeodactylibacter xiamenensis]|uniref:Secretion system C-terminal sorting domain-containing protein n=2 Tax=Phaeodactylibacter xiamenensis TaxID=1524460 RepID=A0A098S038_9BACT|nr:hypothetical protein IX84_28910 [Phaeodactylibacter xiamenensis]